MQLCRGWRSRYLFFVPLVLFLPLLLSVSELHQSYTTMGKLKKEHPKKSDHLVLGPAAGEGLPNRLQCEGLKAMNKIPLSNPRRTDLLSDKVSFVTLFTIYDSKIKESTDMEDKSSTMVTVGDISYSKIGKSMAILNTFVNFIQVSMPKSNVIILTDPSSEFSIRRSTTSIVHIAGDYSRGKLMLQRIRSYIAFLEKGLEEHIENPKYVNHFIFTDSDVAVVDNLEHLFQKYPDFHLALTFRNNKDQPLNSGFIAVRGTPDGILRGKIFLQEVLSVYTKKYMKASRMLGDQLALAWVVKSHLPFAAKQFRRPEAFSSDMNGTSVLFLPCAVYNWTPPEGAGQFHGMPLDVQVVHFKGSRKRLMLEAWNFFNSTSNMRDMMCLILRSGRTKYDF